MSREDTACRRAAYRRRDAYPTLTARFLPFAGASALSSSAHGFDAALAELVLEALATPGEAERAAVCARIQECIDREAPIVPLPLEDGLTTAAR